MSVLQKEDNAPAGAKPPHHSDFKNTYQSFLPETKIRPGDVNATRQTLRHDPHQRSQAAPSILEAQTYENGMGDIQQEKEVRTMARKAYSIKLFRKEFGWGHQGSLYKTRAEAKKTAEWGYSDKPYEKYKIVPVSLTRYRRRTKKGLVGFVALERRAKG